MQLSPDAIADFKAIYRTEYGVELSDAEAEEKARRLVQLFETMAHALTRVPERHRALDSEP